MVKANNKEILKNKLIKLALLQYKKKYLHGEHGPDTFDCAGFVWYLYNEVFGINIYDDGIGLSTTTKIMTGSYGKLYLFDEFCDNKDISLLDAGDILFFHRQSKGEFKPCIDNKYPGHCGIYLGDNYFIHCSGTKKEVRINKLVKEKYWIKKLVGNKNIISYLDLGY